MALQKSITAESGVVCSSAYIVVEHFVWMKGTNKLMVSAGIYKDLASRDAGKAPIGNIGADFILDIVSESDITHVQAYNALKTLPELAGALDV